MQVQALGYVGIGASDLPDWTEFATRWLGMQMVERGNACRAFRMDDRSQRLVVDRSLADGERYFGFEVADAASLDANAALVRQRSGFAPGGNRLEAFWGAAVADEPFRPGRSISGFRTGPLGMGHAVFHVKNIDDLLGFYRDVLGFGVSDFILTPFRAYFLHINPRHHSVALIETGRQDLHHLMVELYSLDDVGQGYDIALGEPERIATTLGRHPNDCVTSYYLRSPSGFMLEYGWGGKEVTPGNWQATEVTVGPSLWGHDRAWLGMREPLHVLDGNFSRMHGVCPWWDSAKQAS